ncbi:MAG: hypothetical protein H9W82_16485 [Lactobacillus sp.]|nr:hypothetical protein [Lactobacillus sp.]
MNDAVTQVNKETEHDFSIDQLKSIITVEQEEDSQVFNLFVVYKDPEIAKFINSCVASSLEKNISKLLGEENVVSIISPATVSTDPISPNLKMNTALGFILGMLISMLVIYIKSLKDSTLDIEDDIEKELQLTNLGHISTIKTRSNKEFAIKGTTTSAQTGGELNEKITSRRRNRR